MNARGWFKHIFQTLRIKLNKDIDEVQKWLQSNKLTLNVKKIKYMIIGSHYRLRHLSVRVDSQQLMRATIYRYLGIGVDESLGWHCQVDIICKKVSAGLGALKRIRPLVPSQTLVMLLRLTEDACTTENGDHSRSGLF